MNVRLSVVVPIYGVEQYLRQCVDSILAACGEIESEIILVDDGGKDGCPAICDEYAQKVAKQGGRCAIRVIHKKNGGYGSAVNQGFDIAQGDWISIVEPDDWVEMGMYKALLAGIDNEDVDIVKAHFQFVLPSGEFLPPKFEDMSQPRVAFKISDYPSILYKHPSIWSAIYRKTFLERNRIRMREVPGAGWVDNPFFVQTMCLARGIIYRQEIVYNYRSPNDPLKELRGNWEMPYERMKDETAWFAKNEIASDVLCSRYRTYLHYLGLMSKCALDDHRCWRKVSNAVRDVVSGLDHKAILHTTVLNKREKDAFLLFFHMPNLAILRFKNRQMSRCIMGVFRLWGMINRNIYDHE